MAFWRALLLCCCLWGLLAPTQAELLELSQAHVSTIQDGVVLEQETRLPYNWDRQHGWRSGSAVFEIPLRLDQPPTEPYAVYFARVGNRAEIWLNGVLLSRFGDLTRPNHEDYAKAPQYVLIPAQLLQRENQFRVILHADGGRRGGLSTMRVGPEVEVREHYHSVYRWSTARLPSRSSVWWWASSPCCSGRPRSSMRRVRPGRAGTCST